MKFLSLSVWLGLLCAGLSSAAPASPLAVNEISVTDALIARSALEKREVFYSCNNQHFSTYLSQAIPDARKIINNAVEHLNLALSLYNEDGSGRLKTTKDDRKKRTFDEHNAWATYSQFIAKLKWPDDDENGLAKSKAGIEKIKGTRDLAKALVKQYDNYLAGRSVPWTRGGIPYIRIYCDDGDFLSERDSQGRTYTEATGYQDWFYDESTDTRFVMVSRSEGPEMNRKEVWVPRAGVCALQPGAGQTRFGGVTVLEGAKAYVSYPIFGLVEEAMTFCPMNFDSWTTVEDDRTARGIHWRDMHVEIGEDLSDAQSTAVETLLARPEISATVSHSKGIKWLSNFLVSTFIHESTHAQAFVGGTNTLIDIKCAKTGFVTTVPGCMASAAKGEDALDGDGNPQGHKDAEAFAIYAMAMYNNAVHWYKYRPYRRNTYQN
ncbi:hypothetical protein BDV11DRAFT_169960 [Aspergillus similis]